MLNDDPDAATLPTQFYFDVAECVGNLIPCVRVASDNRLVLREFDRDEIMRTADYAAHLRLGAALRALRAPPAEVARQTLAQRYAPLPADLHSPGHTSGVSVNVHSLYVVDR